MSFICFGALFGVVYWYTYWLYPLFPCFDGVCVYCIWGRNAAWVSHFIALGNKTLHAWISWSYMGLRFTPTKMMDVKWTSALTFVNTAAPDIEFLHLTSTFSTSHRVPLPHIDFFHLTSTFSTSHRVPPPHIEFLYLDFLHRTSTWRAEQYTEIHSRSQNPRIRCVTSIFSILRTSC